MNYDITFCSNTKCKNLECKRNLNSIPAEFKDRFIWQGEFKECEYWEERKNENIRCRIRSNASYMG